MHTWATNARHTSSMQNAVSTPIEQPITADLADREKRIYNKRQG